LIDLGVESADRRRIVRRAIRINTLGVRLLISRERPVGASCAVQNSMAMSKTSPAPNSTLVIADIATSVFRASFKVYGVFDAVLDAGFFGCRESLD
jgi:hypothetical protein